MDEGVTIDCPVCFAAAGVPCSPNGSHFARVMKAGRPPKLDEE